MNYLTLLLRFRTRNENKTRKKRGLTVFHELAKSVKRNYTVPYKFNSANKKKKAPTTTTTTTSHAHKNSFKMNYIMDEFFSVIFTCISQITIREKALPSSVVTFKNAFTPKKSQITRER